MEYFGKEIVNYFLMVYIAIGGSVGIRSIIEAVVDKSNFAAYDKNYLLDINIKLIGLELQATLFDFFCFFISGLQMVLYVWLKANSFSIFWVVNNILALIFCIHALQSMFLGNFKNGVLLLVLLFFYDIFFVFGTDVMLTVAKGIDAPIKLMFPKDYSFVNEEGESKPKYSILGLGDIVIPGVFVSLCLRFDFLKSIDPDMLTLKIKQELEGKDVFMTDYLIDAATKCKKHYYMAVNFGYFVAIICTVIVMLVFDHGQPALLYLVPGCILTVLGTAVAKGEFSKLWNFSEDEFITPPEAEEEDGDGKDGDDDKAENKKDK